MTEEVSRDMTGEADGMNRGVDVTFVFLFSVVL